MYLSFLRFQCPSVLVVNTRFAQQKFFVDAASTKTRSPVGLNANAVSSGAQIVVKVATFSAIHATAYRCANFIALRIPFS